MNKKHGVLQSLARKLLLQAMFISIAAALSLYLTTFMLENVLVEKALDLESNFFWDDYHKNNKEVRLPYVYNLTGYLEGYSKTIPDNVKNKGLGIHELVDEQGTKFYLHVSEQDDKTFYLVYNNAQVNKLVAVYGLVPLFFVLMLLYISTWLAYRSTNQALSPMMWLARRVNTFKPQTSNAQEFLSKSLPSDANEEVTILADALYKFAERIDAFVKRERDFTRDASHELRTPLTVINAATDVMLLDEKLSQSSIDSLNKIKRSCSNMEELIQAFLMMARESEGGDIHEDCNVNKVVHDEIEEAKFLAVDKPLDIRLFENKHMDLQAPKRVVSALIGNLLRNAVNYTDKGYIEVVIGHGFIEVNDTGEGIPEDQLDNLFRPFFRGNKSNVNGFGVGLTIVNRILEQRGWMIEIDSTVGKGTKIKVLFPDATVQPV